MMMLGSHWIDGGSIKFNLVALVKGNAKKVVCVRLFL